MKMKAGKSWYTIPPFGELLGVSFSYHHHGGYYNLLRMQEGMPPAKERGTPRYFTIERGRERHGIRVYPIPERSGELVVRYYPPAREV